MYYNNPHITYTSPKAKREFRAIMVENINPNGNYKAASRILIEFLDNLSKAWIYYDSNYNEVRKEKFNN